MSSNNDWALIELDCHPGIREHNKFLRNKPLVRNLFFGTIMETRYIFKNKEENMNRGRNKLSSHFR